MRKYESLIEKEYGDLKVEAPASLTPAGSRRWLSRCKCGNTMVALESNLKRLHTQSCGYKKSPDLAGNSSGNWRFLVDLNDAIQEVREHPNANAVVNVVQSHIKRPTH